MAKKHVMSCLGKESFRRSCHDKGTWPAMPPRALLPAASWRPEERQPSECCCVNYLCARKQKILSLSLYIYIYIYILAARNVKACAI